jgi:hypothetical protein
MWEMIVAFVSATFIIPVLQQPRWHVATRAVVTFLYSLVVGLVTAYLEGSLDTIRDFRTGVSSVLLFLITAIASYKGFAQPMQIAPAIEHATSPSSGRHHADP